MNANEIIHENMTIDEKLAAIDAAMAKATQEANKAAGRPLNAPVDPSTLTICEGCE